MPSTTALLARGTATSSPRDRCAFPWLLVVLLAACSSGDPGVSVIGVEVAPASVALLHGGTQQFSAIGLLSDGTAAPLGIAWTATGGTVTSAGLYTAGVTDGTFRVVASAEGGSLADTATVSIATPPPTLVAVEVTPASAALAPAGTQQFSAVGRLSNNTTQPVAVTWSATGGTITVSGAYTAGAVDGAWRAIATTTDGLLADTADVTITTPPPTIVAIEIAPDSARLSYTQTQQFTAVGRLSSGGTAPVAVTWQATTFPTNPAANTIGADGTFRAGAAIGRYMVTATQQGGTGLTAQVPVIVHSTTGRTVSPGPAFWAPTAGVVSLCTSNHFTDDGASRGGVASVSVSSGGGVVAPSIPYVNDGTPYTYADGTGEVRVWCQQAWVAPVGMSGTVDVTISVASTRPGTGMAKVFTYDQPCLVADCRANYNPGPAFFRDFAPLWTAAPVAITVTVGASTGANIWFKNTYLP